MCLVAQSCPTLCDPVDCSPPGSSGHGDSPGKNTGVGCHFLLQCMQVKRETGVAQPCPTLSKPVDCSPPGSSIHRIFQARVLEWVAIASSRGGNLVMPKDLKQKHTTIQMRSPQVTRTHGLWHTSHLPKTILTNFYESSAYLSNSKRILCTYLLQKNMNMLWLLYISVLSVE